MRGTSGVQLAWVVVACALAAAGCTSVPIQEMSDARRAVASARGAGAESLIPGGLARAERLVDDAGAALAAGDYEGAREAATAAKTEAVAVRALALRLVRLEQAIAEAERTGGAVTEVRALGDRASRAARAGSLAEAATLIDAAVDHPELGRSPGR